MKSESRFILIKENNFMEVVEVKAFPLVSDQIKAFINRARSGKKEGWAITSEETGCAINAKLYSTIKEAQEDWPDLEKRCVYLLENPRIREGYEEKKKFFDVMVKKYKEALEFIKELNHA